MSEFQIRNSWYRAGKLDARKQFHVMRRLAPILTDTFSAGDLARSTDVGEFLSVAGPIVTAIADLSDEKADYIIDTCLDAVQRRQGASTWAPVKLANTGQMMFDDIDMTVMLELCWRVIQENMEGFFGEGRLEASAGLKAVQN